MKSNKTTTDKNKNEKQSGLNSSGVKSTTDDTYKSKGETNKKDSTRCTIHYKYLLIYLISK